MREFKPILPPLFGRINVNDATCSAPVVLGSMRLFPVNVSTTGWRLVVIGVIASRFGLTLNVGVAIKL